MKNVIINMLEKALKVSVQKGQLSEFSLPYLELEPPANPEHGDYAANTAIYCWLDQIKQNPRKIAQIIQENISDNGKYC